MWLDTGGVIGGDQTNPRLLRVGGVRGGYRLLDIYFFHHAEFGSGDVYLEPAIEAMRHFREKGLIRATGMRGPHRFALDRLAHGPCVDKVARFRELFERIQPDVLAVRNNLSTLIERISVVTTTST
ncbi:MAG: hypothetical protein ACRDSR_00515 [Pseudonocardiaceae bacterium]